MSAQRSAVSWYRGPGIRTVFLLLLGFAAIWIGRSFVGIQDGVVLASFVIVPAVLYVVLRGDLAELKGPGGWAATFVKVATATVSAASEKLDIDSDVQIIAKESMQGLTNRASTLASSRPAMMTMTVGRRYSRPDVQGYLDTLAQLPRFRIVAFLDSTGMFLGCISSAELREIMRSPALGDELLSAISRSDISQMFHYPGMLRLFIQSTATNAEALSAMTLNNLGSLVVVGEDRRLRGIVERDQLVSKLVVSLATGGTYTV